MRTTFRMVCLAASGALAAVSTGFSAELETERWQREIDAAQIVHSQGVSLVDIPLYDSPCLICERRALSGKVTWK